MNFWLSLIVGMEKRQFRSNLYIPFSQTNRGSIKKEIGMAVNRLVGMELKSDIPAKIMSKFIP